MTEIVGSSIIFLTVLVVTLLMFLPLFAFLFVLYILEAIPLYKMARSLGKRHAWLAWMPISYCRLFLMCDLPGNKPVELIPGKWVLQNRAHSYVILLGVVLGGFMVSSILTTLGMIPYIGIIFSLISVALSMIPAAVCAYIRYIYLKDVLDLFNEDKKSNSTTAILISLLDFFLTLGLARVIYLLIVMRRIPSTTPAEAAESL